MRHTNGDPETLSLLAVPPASSAVGGGRSDLARAPPPLAPRTPGVVYLFVVIAALGNALFGGLSRDLSMLKVSGPRARQVSVRRFQSASGDGQRGLAQGSRRLRVAPPTCLTRRTQLATQIYSARAQALSSALSRRRRRTSVTSSASRRLTHGTRSSRQRTPSERPSARSLRACYRTALVVALA